MNDTWVYVALAAAVLVVGGVAVALRSRGAAPVATPVAAPAPVETVTPETVAPEPVAVAAPPSFRDRLSRARGVFATATTGVLRRTTIDQSTWDDLEEAMLRADLGVKVTTALL
ncbi:MAG: signal recognition particle receptor subunit alpha, partial [Ilumatobacteraceae bacterium]|nr:signal recognition particle receptor subunit alpha [Ilumatobacteraceae bacterium]